MHIQNIDIEDGLYDRKLLEHLWHKKFDKDFDKELFEILQKLCRAELIKEFNLSSNLFLTDREKEIINSIDIITACNNKEVVARWCDYVQEFDKNKRPQYIKICSNNYREIFKVSKNYEYIVRGLQLILKAKGLFTNELEEIYMFSKEEIIKSKTPFWQHLIIKEVVEIFGIEKCRQDFSDVLEERMQLFNEEKRFSEARLCIDSLHETGSLTSNERHIKKAENFEKEGDCIDNNREPNTLYPNLSERYLNGLKEIYSIGDCENLKQRLKDKVAKTQKENFDMIKLIGIPMIPEVDYKEVYKIISELNIESFETAFKELISLPIVSEGIINNYVDISKSSHSLLMEFLSQTVKIDHNGAKVALTTGDERYINNSRSFIRERCIAIIKELKLIMDTYKQIDKGFVFGLIEQSKSRFIPNDRVYIYALAINYGFNNDFISAAHLLVPQIENSFRHVASQNEVHTIRWQEDLQYQNIFGGILEKIEDFVNSDLHAELHNFLVDGNSNFRNNVCHGLSTPIMIDYYGSYLWWLTLKMIFQTENYFSFKKKLPK